MFMGMAQPQQRHMGMAPRPMGAPASRGLPGAPPGRGPGGPPGRGPGAPPGRGPPGGAPLNRSGPPQAADIGDLFGSSAQP